jgi:hypothetical protein
MNYKQRAANRRTAEVLNGLIKSQRVLNHTCENCGKSGAHWITIRGTSVNAMVTGVDDQVGFWTCA